MNRELRFLIVAFDGLRPDMVRDDIAPNLVAFRREGVHFQDCRSVFPSETRVNQATLVTGCHPAGHGIVANKFVEAEYGGYLNTTDFEQLTTANEVLNGELLTVPSLGEVLHASGGSLAVIGCGTAGGDCDFADAPADGICATYRSCWLMMFEQPAPRCNGRQGSCADLAQAASLRLSWPFLTIGPGGNVAMPPSVCSPVRGSVAGCRVLWMA